MIAPKVLKCLYAVRAGLPVSEDDEDEDDEKLVSLGSTEFSHLGKAIRTAFAV